MLCTFNNHREFKSLIEVLAVVGEKIDQGNFNSKGDDLASELKVNLSCNYDERTSLDHVCCMHDL